MKVLHVIASVDPRDGGPIEGVFSSSEVWSQHGHQRHILCLDPPDAPWVAQSRAPTVAVGPSGRWHRLARRWIPLLRYAYTPHLVGWLRTHGGSYDAVIVNGLWNYASFGTWRGLRGADTPYFLYTHGMLDPWFNHAYPTKTLFKTLFWKLFEYRVLRDATGVMFTCEEERRLASRSFAPYRGREYVVSYGARDISGDAAAQRAAFAERVPGVAGRKFVLFLSRIHPKKGCDLLIEGFSRLAPNFPDLDLVMAGPDQTGWRTELENLTAARGLKGRIHWPGMLSGEAKWGAFRSAEVFALPSHQENFGVVVAEAMAAGRPVLITDKVNIWREIEADGAGLVVTDDLKGISDGLSKFFSMSAEDLAAMGRKARACFAARYDLNRNAMELLALLQALSRDSRISTRSDAAPA